MARFVSFSPFNTTGTPGAGGMTLDALMKRQADLAKSATQLPEAQDMRSPWQGAAYLGNVLGDKISQGRAANDITATRDALSKITAGIDYDAGPSSEQIAQVQQYDPDLAEKLLQQKLDRAKEQRGYTQQEEMQRAGFEQNTLSREDAQTEARTSAGRKTVTGAEATALGLPPDRVWQVAPGGAVTDVTPTQIDEWKDYVDPRQPNVPMQRNDKTGEVKAKGVQTKVTSADLKARFAQEDAAVSLENTLKNLRRATELNANVPTGSIAQTQARLHGNYPDWLPGREALTGTDATADASNEFWSIMDQNAIASMSEMLKGATTDTELMEFKKIMSDPNSTPQVRQRTIDRMTSLMQRQYDVSKARLDDMNGGTSSDVATTPPPDVTAAPVAPSPTDVPAAVAKAKAAIANGADRAKVLERLQAAGIPTEGL